MLNSCIIFHLFLCMLSYAFLKSVDTFVLFLTLAFLNLLSHQDIFSVVNLSYLGTCSTTFFFSLLRMFHRFIEICFYSCVFYFDLHFLKVQWRNAFLLFLRQFLFVSDLLYQYAYLIVQCLPIFYKVSSDPILVCCFVILDIKKKKKTVVYWAWGRWLLV